MRALTLFCLLLCACPQVDDDDSAGDDDDSTPVAFDEALALELQAELESQHAAHEAPAMTLAVVDGNGAIWEGAVGVEDPATGVAVEPSSPFNIASISKTYTAGLILLLVDDGALSLDDTLGDHRPDLHPRADEITVRHLLQHSAGVPEATATPDFQADPTRAWTAEELVAFVSDDPLLFEPGTDYGYSNTHFILLGLIADEVGEAPWREQMQDRIFEPLGLDDTRAPGAEGWGDMVPSFVGGQPVTLRVHPLAIGAAGGLVSTARDGAFWAQARFGGGLLSAELMSAQIEQRWYITPDFGSGLGLIVIDDGEGQQLAHNGALNGYAGWMGYRTDLDVSISLLANAWGAGNPPDFQYTGPLSDAIWRVIDGED